MDDLFVGWYYKCSLNDTIIGTTVLNGAIYTIDAMPPSLSAYFNRARWAARWADIFGLFNAVIELGYVLNLRMYKTDAFNSGRVIAKMTKIYWQFKLYRLTQDHYMFDKSYEELDFDVDSVAL